MAHLDQLGNMLLGKRIALKLSSPKLVMIGLKSWLESDKLVHLSWTENDLDTPAHELLKYKLH